MNMLQLFDIRLFLSIMLLMSIGLREPSSQASQIVEQNEGALAPFFLEKNSGREGIIQLDDPHENVKILRGTTANNLRETFDPLIRQNNRGLRYVWINRHDARHMRRVAAAAHSLGKQLGYDENSLDAITLGTDFHDVGYTFSDEFFQQVQQGTLDSLSFGKSEQDHHPATGADLFSQSLDEIRNANPLVQHELSEWTDRDYAYAHQAILFHSNGSAYKPDEVHNAVKLPRMFDKLDNIAERVYPVQINGFRALAHGQSPEEVKKAVRENTHITLTAYQQSPYSPDEAFEVISTVDPYFQHRIVSYAITGQFLERDPQTNDMIMHYAVDTERISREFGFEFTSEMFLKQFSEAYDKGAMPRAAEVAYSVKNEKSSQYVSPDAPSFVVRFYFSNGKSEEMEYKPRFD